SKRRKMLRIQGCDRSGAYFEALVDMRRHVAGATTRLDRAVHRAGVVSFRCTPSRDVNFESPIVMAGRSSHRCTESLVGERTVKVFAWIAIAGDRNVHKRATG